MIPVPNSDWEQDILIELHGTFCDNLWDDSDILRAMQLSYLLTQAPNAESAEQIIDVWLTTYWDSASYSDEEEANMEHIKSIMREEH